MDKLSQAYLIIGRFLCDWSFLERKLEEKGILERFNPQNNNSKQVKGLRRQLRECYSLKEGDVQKMIKIYKVRNKMVHEMYQGMATKSFLVARQKDIVWLEEFLVRPRFQ